MTDEQKFELIEKAKKDIQAMNIKIKIDNNTIRLIADDFEADFDDSGYIVHNTPSETMDQEQFENYAAEVDNLNRAILWVNRIKDLILNH